VFGENSLIMIGRVYAAVDGLHVGHGVFNGAENAEAAGVGGGRAYMRDHHHVHAMKAAYNLLVGQVVSRGID
jgi:hypothetical protein